MEEQYFAVRANGESSVEMDIIDRRCRQLRTLMRARPTLPLNADGGAVTASELAAGVKLPLYSCPFLACQFATSDRDAFSHHIAGGAKDRTHAMELERICRGVGVFFKSQAKK